jgi:hypothetical protein
VAKNTDNTIYGGDMTFTTGGIPPTATTDAATAVSSSGATLNGTVKANNENTIVTFEYGLTNVYGSTQPADQNPVTGNSSTPVSGTINGLTGNTTYHYRVVAQNGFGTTYGLDKTFFTGATVPTAITKAATGVSSTTATLNGAVIANNASTTVTFEFGIDTSYGRSINANPNLVSGSTNIEVSSILTGLLPSTTYHYRVVAVNSVGTTNGTDEAFATSTVDDIEQVNFSVPTEYSLKQNYPNPFNPTTLIEFTLPKPEYVELKVFNNLGIAVAELVSENLTIGVHRRQFDGSEIATGVYYYQIVAGEFSDVKKMILIR